MNIILAGLATGVADPAGPAARPGAAGDVLLPAGVGQWVADTAWFWPVVGIAVTRVD